MTTKGSHLTEEHKQKIAIAARGNLNRLEHGGRSKQVQAVRPVKCDSSCVLWDRCPKKIGTGLSICPMNEEFMSLANTLSDDRFYDHGALAGFLSRVLQMQGTRFSRAAYLEQVDGGGDLDPEVTKLGQVLATDLMKLARLVGHDNADPKTMIDARQIHIHEGLGKQEKGQVLEILAQLRDYAPALVESILEEIG
jgi:hypothetical protein